MEVAAIQYLVLLVLFPLSLALIFLFRNCRALRLNLPPGTQGWPMIGENIELAFLGPQKFVKDRMKKFSQEVFQTSIF